MTDKEKALELVEEYESTVPAGLYESERTMLVGLFLEAIRFGIEKGLGLEKSPLSRDWNKPEEDEAWKNL